jgi:hypothetical protein
METTYPPTTRLIETQWHADAGHAWMAVSADEIRNLKIADQISGYSYLSKGIVYLEEDCDAPRFIQAARSAGIGFNPSLEKRYNGNAPIRRMGRFVEYAQNYHPTQLF